ncbi:hydroxyacylglutathione hydrolase [Actibacterium sp. XHP0104]|uniref:hydroxyacylglutathione hydrolase n=1 Tax=Actibacterium sp. XHP0104 TaxID=2984335 RepID=UPI0021E8B8E0|nr:hydroxyacylglutathione hydrolase [Actibacterium sp. XHP0104]MCV2882275.1 hydroxyacylglutathione hydrolase [Actibacterium sp. XHP0104]
MPLEIVTVPCLSDNYAYLLHNAATGETALVDAPEEAPIRAALAERGWRLTDILITHHHYDHTDAVDALRADSGARVVGAAADAHRLPALDLTVAEGDPLTVCGEPAQVIEVHGHTIGHIAFYLPETGAAFTADSLMALGCGRLFEGDADTMWASLSKLAALPADTVICSGHEYTQSNAKFALTIEPDNPDLISRSEAVAAARAKGQPTVPSTLSEELATNPFLRASLPQVKENIGLAGSSDAQSFAEIRKRKDRF